MTRIARAIVICGAVAGLGVATLPNIIHAADNKASLQVSATINDYVAIEAQDSTVVVADQVVNNGSPEYAGTSINIKTNAENYYVQISAADGDTNMTSASTGATIEAGTPEAGASRWGYAYSDQAVADASQLEYQGVTAEAQTLLTRTDGTPTSEGEDVNLYFGVSAAADQAAGVYNGEVTLTAVAGVQNVPVE